MDYRDEMDRMAHEHGYEEREDSPNCSDCIHQPMCSGNNCHFDMKWYPEDLKKMYYRVNDFESRMEEDLYSMRDRYELAETWPSDEEGPYFMDKRDWEESHPERDFTVRVAFTVLVKARDDIEARRLACKEAHVDPDDRSLEADILHEYRMPVEYICCEEGRTWDHEYIMAKNAEEARFKFMSEWIPDIEAIPSFNDIEGYDEEFDEWYDAMKREGLLK